MSSIANMNSPLRLMLAVHAHGTRWPREMYAAMIDVLTGQAGVRKAADRHGLSLSTLADSLSRFRRAAAGACDLAGVPEADLVVSVDRVLDDARREAVAPAHDSS